MSLASVSSLHKGPFTLTFYFCTLCILFSTAPHLEALSSPSGLDLHSFLQPGAEFIFPVSRPVVVLPSLFSPRMALVKDSYFPVSQTVQVQSSLSPWGVPKPSSYKSGSTHFSLPYLLSFLESITLGHCLVFCLFIQGSLQVSHDSSAILRPIFLSKPGASLLLCLSQGSCSLRPSQTVGWAVATLQGREDWHAQMQGSSKAVLTQIVSDS